MNEFKPLRRDGFSAGLIFLLFGATLSLWVLTQHLAGTFGFASHPIAHVGTWSIYSPTDVLRWTWDYHPQLLALQHRQYAHQRSAQLALRIFDSQITLAAALGAFTLVGSLVAAVLYGRKELPTSGSYGTARWATSREIKRAGLLK